MKAIRIERPGLLKVVDLKKPVPGEGEVLLKLNYVGFCGSDLSTYLGKNPMVQYPRVPGHEISAVIEAVGPNVPVSCYSGTQVTVIPYTSCGECPSCRRGRSHACQFNQTLGIQREGAMMEYMVMSYRKILKAPKLNNLELAMVEPLTVGFHAVERARVAKGETIAVFGCGMIGAGAIVAANSVGATVIAVDIDDWKLELAIKLGAKYPVNSKTFDLHTALMELTAGKGPDVVVEAAGNPITYRAAIDEVAFTGRVICIGYAGDEVPFATKLFVQKELDILGSRNAASDDFIAVINYLQKGSFPLEEIITRKVKPAKAAEAVQKWAEDPGKVMKILLDFT